MAKERTSPLTQLLHQMAGPPPDRHVADRHLLERFVTAHDQAAFAALVQRHGPMVLGVCRRLLPDAHEAEDAFQATFLVLVHKARAIGQPELLGPWLHGVAYRTAARARQSARRRARPREAMARPDGDPAVEVTRRELCQVLDEELGRLAPKYRAPLVLCYLEGKTTEEVARQLGCPKGTVLSRLARGRTRLRQRLVRRGVALAGGVLASGLMGTAAPAAVPTPLAVGTVKAAMWTAAGHAAAGAIPATVAALTKGVLRAMFLSKLKCVAAVVLIGAVAALGTIVGAWPAPAGNGAQLAPADQPAAAATEAAPQDAEKMVGTWTILSAERGGQKIPPEAHKEGKWTFTADGKVTARFRGDGGPELGGTYQLDPAKKPKEITITTNDGQAQPSIYKLDGDTLTLCMGDADVAKERPTEFATKAGTKVMLFVLKRAKDKEQIMGSWAAVSVEKDGQPLPEAKVKEGKLIFGADGKVTVNEGGREMEGTYQLEPTKKPKAITLTSTDGRTLPGIYKLDGDTLTICMGEENGKERPTEFVSQAGTKVTLLVLKREKK